MNKYIKLSNMDGKILNLKFRNIIGLIIISFSCISLFAQTTDGQNAVIVKGLVIDGHSKQPLNAVRISDLDKKTSAVTDDKGSFTIKARSKSSILNVVAYDYNTVEIPVQGKDYLVIELYSDKFSNYFKNINTPAGEKRNSETTVSIKSTNEINLLNVATADELLPYSLAADIRGITRSGLSGEGSSLFIRGINSINANAQPLFIVDGVIWNNLYDATSIQQGYFANTLDNIDMNDIESISVLKDGTSIYGSKGSNGVVIIKTKRASSTVTKINLNILTGYITRPANFPMLKGDEFRVYASDLLKSQGIAWNSNTTKFDFLEANQSNAMIYNMYHNNTDWSNEVYQNGMVNSYNINVTGGDERALYYFSLGYTGNKGVVKTTDMQRINSRFNADLTFNKYIFLGLNVGFSRVERQLLDDGINEYSSPVWMSKIKSPFTSPYSYTTNGELTLDYAKTDSFNIGNPGGVIANSHNNSKKFRFNIGFMPTIKFTRDLTLSSNFDYSLDKSVERRFVPMLYTPVRPMPGYGNSFNEINSQVMRNTGIFDDTRLAYARSFSSAHNLKAMLGWRFVSNYYELDYIEEHNTGANNNTTITGSRDFLQVKGLNNHTKSISNYLNAEYNYDYRYFINATVALDGSSRFGSNTKGGLNLFGHSWGVFPSINGAWIVSAEKFMGNTKNAISLLKLRAGYGITGNDGIMDNESMAYFASVRFMNRANGIVLANLSNPELQWETTGRANLGIDVILFNRLSVSFDCFTSKTSNLLVLKDLPDVSGLGKYWSNDGEMKNNGFESSLNWRALNLRNLKWELGASVGHYENMITALPNGNYTTSVYDGEVITAVGNSAGSFWGYKTNGVFASAADAEAAGLKILNPDGTYTKFGAGDMKFIDVDNNRIINSLDKQVIGNPNPDFYGNLMSKISYLRFTLNTVFSYSYGNNVYNYQRSKLESGLDYSNQTSAMLRSWVVEGQNTDVPKAYYGDPMGNSRFSDRWIEDGSYIKLKNVTLSYDLPLKSDFIGGINFWISANNVLTLTNYLGLDPEFSVNNSVYYQGVDAGLLPATRSYYFGVKFSL
ncbi:MAG: SusC/RagA family TonB-linked outer membrane protein [Paludibacteraceae bacterium]